MADDRANVFAAKAKDLDALRASVVDAAGVGAGLWISYLFVLLYLLIATGGVTHRDLLFESPIKLPFLSVELPLVGFFVLGPLLFLIVHAYVLLHFVLLADKVGVFHAELAAQIADDEVRARLRRQLPSNIFVQYLAGPREVRTGIMGFLLRLIAQISLVVAPLALLVFMLFQFLPYHNELVAWWQRLAVVADLALLWTLWPAIARGETASIAWRDFRRIPVAGMAAASLGLLLLVFTVATFPGEWLDKNPLTVRFIPAEIQFDRHSYRLISLHNFLVGGDVNFVARKPTSLWSNRLVLPDIDATNVSSSLSLRGRRLEGAVLFQAKLAKVDFTAADLTGAQLAGADLREAKFNCAAVKEGGNRFVCTRLNNANLYSANLQGAELKGTLLHDANLNDAQLQNAILELTELVNAKLIEANLQGAKIKNLRMRWATLDRGFLREVKFESSDLRRASLRGAHMQAAGLNGAYLEGAILDTAELQGATLVHARLHGASLRGTHLEGASLDKAELQGAMVHGAHLQGATLNGAVLHGARLNGAYLQGALMIQTQLQGATFVAARLQGAMLDHVYAWRAHVPPSAVRVVAAETGARYRTDNCHGSHAIVSCEWTPEAFDELNELIESGTSGQDRDEALRQIAVLDPGKESPTDGETARAWADLARTPLALDIYENGLREAGCDKAGAPYVIRRLLEDLSDRFEENSPRPAALAAMFLDETQCAGANGLTDEDKTRLREIRDRLPPGSSGSATAEPKQ
jgi:uncharacterized protein YjbI with pentapeptide repeats